ncbi:hypothetical protein ABPG72_021040 [Tetrahymena utriculariae]
MQNFEFSCSQLLHNFEEQQSFERQQSLNIRCEQQLEMPMYHDQLEDSFTCFNIHKQQSIEEKFSDQFYSDNSQQSLLFPSSNLNEQHLQLIIPNPNTIRDDFSEILEQLLGGEKIKQWFCKECKQRFSAQGSFTNHIKAIHLKRSKQDKIKVEIYHYLLRARAPRGRPKGSKSTKKTLRPKKCLCICGKSYTQTGSLDKHIEAKHGIQGKEKIKGFYAHPRRIGRPRKNMGENGETTQ